MAETHHPWDICAREDTPPVESEQMLLFACVRQILEEDFGVVI
jgi:hypothetical protein